MFNTIPNTNNNSNPIFSSYSLRNADFNENMDEFVKAPNDVYIEEQKKKSKAVIAKDVNKMALEQVKERPAFLKEEFEYVNKKPAWLEELEKNVATAEDIENWKKQGSIGIGEVAKQGKKWGYMIPYAGSSAEATLLVRNANTLRRLKDGEEVSSVDLELLYDFLREEKEREVRGVTFAGKTLDGVRTGVGYLAEFGLGLATIPEGGVGFAGLGKTLATIGGKKAARKAVEAALKEAAIKSAAPAAVKTTVPLSTAKKIYKDTLVKTTGAKALANVGMKEAAKETVKALPQAITSSAKFGSTYMSPHLVNDIASKQLASGIYITDYGDAVLTDSENLALSIMKAFGSSTFEAMTETVGWSFSPVAGYFAAPMQKLLPKKFFTEFEKLVSSRYGMAASEALKKYGYDGVLEEMGEEVLNRFLCQVFGINGLDEYNFDGFMNNVFYANDLSQWGVEALTFAAIGGGGHAVAGAGSKISDEWKKRKYDRDVANLTKKANKYIQSPEQFYLDQGLIKIKGSQSLAEQRLREIWTERNIDENLQNNVLENMSETEIRSELKKVLEQKTENQTPEEASEKIEKDLTKKFMDNKIFAKEKDAKTVAALFTAPLKKLSETTGISLKELMEEEMPEIQREAEEAAKANGRFIHVDSRIEEIFKELDELPDDYSDTEYIDYLVQEVDILSKIRDGVLTDEDFVAANRLINETEAADYIDLANELRAISNYEFETVDDYMIRTEAEGDILPQIRRKGQQLNQTFNVDKHLLDNFGMTASELTEMVRADIENILVESGVEEDEFKIEDIRVYGSYVKNKNKKTSDLDFVVQYSGSMREDDAFNMLNDEKLTIEDKDGREVEIDINPIHPDKSGTIAEYLAGDTYFQSAETAGTEGSAEISAAKKEWEEKGTESSYFKKWFGNSKVVDENGKPLVVYHGTAAKFDAFSYDKIGTNGTVEGVGFYFTDDADTAAGYKKIDGEVKECYLSIQKPLEHNSHFLSFDDIKNIIYKAAELQSEEYEEDLKDSFVSNYADTYSMDFEYAVEEAAYMIYSEDKSDTDMLGEIAYAANSEFANRATTLVTGYDGVITNGYGNLGQGGGNFYIPFNPEQIKSVNNEGYFDSYNDNIYYQSAYHGTPHRFDEFSLDAIGTGEGAQAHGWGLYFAADKNVSEDYRKKLTGQLDEIIPVEISYNNTIITDAELALALEKTKKENKKAGIEYLEKEIKQAESIIEEAKKHIGIISKDNNISKEEKNRQIDVFKDNIKSVKENIKETKNNIKFIKELDFSKLKIGKRNQGQLFEVDIPEDDVLLDEDKVISEQSEIIKKAFEFEQNELIKNLSAYQLAFKGKTNFKDINIQEVYGTKYWNEAFEKFKNNPEKYIDKYYSASTITGKKLYEDISWRLGSPKKASKKLNELGIKGITYDGRSDGRCYVVFDDKAVKVLEKYYQARKADDSIQTNMFYDNVAPAKLRNMYIKGAFVPAENLIELFKNADESTIIHEFAHWWLTRLEKYAEQNEELALDLAEVRKFVKNDGGKFTREQHEKFAVGFEAYIRNGSARSNRLKKIFEDFKNALIQIYDSLKQLVYTEDSEQFAFTEADVANLEKLFERLLTTENERIKKTVFDKCDDIASKIKEIKAHQEEEMKELDELWKENIAANNRKSDKKRKIDEYLELAEAAVGRVPKEVKEMQKRYKNVTLDILSVATGMKKNAIANPRNWEKVQMLLDQADDKITASGGMRGEWEEFYTDTGVSYENDEVDGDFKLAEQAFDVLTSDNYNFGNMNEDEIGKFFGKFDYLYNKVQSLKGEEKAVAFEALCTLFNDLPAMPDEALEEIWLKFDKIEAVYEKGQKEDFNRKRYPNIPVVQQLQFYITNKLSELKVYDPEVRYKVRISKSHSLYKAIKHATSVNNAKRIVRKINEYVIADLEAQAKNILHKEIQKQIKINSKLVKIGTMNKGRFDWRTNTVFAELAEMNKMKQKEALKEFGAMIELDRAAAGEERDSIDDNPISTPDMQTDFQSNLRRKFLEYRSNKVKDLNLSATRSLLEDILTLKFEGRRAKDAEELEKQLEKDSMKTDLVERVRELKNNNAAKNIAKFIMGETIVTSEKSLVNWETCLNALFGKEVAQRYSLLKLESDAEVYAHKRYSEFCKKAIEIYGLNNAANFREKAWNKFNEFVDFANNQPLVNLMQEYEEEVYNYKEVTYSKETGQFVETGVLLSRAEIITLYTWSLNEELEQRLFTQYGLHQVQHMFEQVLTEEDKQFAWLLVDTCEGMYEDNNEVFIRTMGLSLPKVENYFPSKTVRVGSEIDMLHENVVRSSNPSFIKQRKTCSRIKMKPDQPLSILLPHINKTARYVVLSERLNYLNAIFKDGTVRAAIKEVFDGVETPDKEKAGARIKGKKNKKQRTVGDRIHDALLNQLGSSTFENYVRGINVGKSFMDYVATNYITSRIGGNLKVMFGQLTSMINYCESMPYGLWAKGFVDCLKHPKETLKYMLENCDYLNARLAGGSMNEVMLKITDEADRFRSLRNFCTTNTKYGDLLAIAFGGKPYVDYLIDQGATKEEAFEKFVEATMRAQQAGQASATSVWQKKQSENPLTRMIFAFNNTTLQYERKFVDAMASRARGDISIKEFVKALLIYKVFNPILFTSFLSNLSFMTLIRGLMGDDEDGVEKFGIDAISAILFANLAAYGYLGMGLTTIGSFAMTLLDKKEYKPFLKTVPIVGDIEEIGRNILLKNEVTVADWVDAMALMADDLTGIPATRFVNSATGVVDAAQGDFAVGALKMFGYGDYRANVAATGNPPNKKKK